METVLSGIRSTGNLHIGNYFGALRNFIRMQQENKDLAGLIESLGAKISVLTGDSGEASLKEISGILSSMENNIGTISSTLSAIAEEA